MKDNNDLSQSIPNPYLIMESILNEEKTKEILTEILIDMMQSKREFFYEIVLEALEEVGLANAITEGRKDDFVSEEEIFSIPVCLVKDKL